MYMYPQGRTQRGLFTGGGGHFKPKAWTERRKPWAEVEYDRGAGSGDLPRIFFLNQCLWEYISNHFEALFSIFYNLNFK